MFYDFIYTNKNTNNTQKYPLFLSNKLFFRFLFLVERKILIFDLLLYLVAQVGLDLMMDLIYRLVSLLVAQVGQI